jgi:uncharacterized protein YndB with AHSA1/START domain
MPEATTVASIVIEIDAPVTAERAWAAVSQPDEVAEWFADVTPIDGIGSPYRVDFGDGSGVEGRIRAFEPGHRFAYSWAWTGEEEAPPTTLVTWVVGAGPAGAVVRLTHEGWAEAGLDQDVRDEHAEYWEGYLESLGDYLANET